LPLETQQARLDPEGADILERASAWWEQYQRLILGALGVIVAVGLGGFLYLKSRSTQENEASGRLAEASVLFWQGDYARSLEISKQVYTEFPSTSSGLDAHRLAGDDAFWNGDFKTAIAEYRRYLDKAKPGILADAARRSLAYSLESDGQALEAAQLYETLVGKSDRASSAEFLVGAARCYRRVGRPAEAIRCLERVDQEYGESSYAQPARIELGELRAAAR
jgi:tetratricopeptide (TPR) repeat protein